jgi:hypothetical protein
MNPIYIACDLIITNDIYNILQHIKYNPINIHLTLDGGNALGYFRYKNNPHGQYMPWDDDIDLALFCDKFDNNYLKLFFNDLLDKNYEIFLYYKDKKNPYSSSVKDHYMGRISKNINIDNYINMDNLFDPINNYEIILFNVYIPADKYKTILNYFNININDEQKYDDNTIKIPSVDIFIYELNNIKTEYIYNKLFGWGSVISYNKNDIIPIKQIKYNNININIPHNIEYFLNSLYGYTSSNPLNIIKIRRHDSITNYDDFNNQNIKIDDRNIIILIDIYNDYINMYYDKIIKNNLLNRPI